MASHDRFDGPMETPIRQQRLHDTQSKLECETPDASQDSDLWYTPPWCNPAHPKYDEIMRAGEAEHKLRMKHKPKGRAKKWWQIDEKPKIGVWLPKLKKGCSTSS
eukprot:5518001-Pyramimonas_sp.AAC.1